MHVKSRSVSAFSRVGALVASLFLVGTMGCVVAADDSATSVDDITAQELREGAGHDGHDGVAPDEHTDEGQTPETLEEPLASEEVFEGQSSCRKATGYRRGRRMSLCVVSIDGKLVERNTASAYRRMADAARRAGVHLHVVSGFRTMAKQRELYRLYKQGRGNLAAPPGYSNHQSGHALDLNTSSGGVYRWLSRNARRFGFRRTVPSEPWHWEH